MRAVEELMLTNGCASCENIRDVIVERRGLHRVEKSRAREWETGGVGVLQFEKSRGKFATSKSAYFLGSVGDAARDAE